MAIAQTRLIPKKTGVLYPILGPPILMWCTHRLFFWGSWLGPKQNKSPKKQPGVLYIPDTGATKSHLSQETPDCISSTRFEKKGPYSSGSWLSDSSPAWWKGFKMFHVRKKNQDVSCWENLEKWNPFIVNVSGSTWNILKPFRKGSMLINVCGSSGKTW